MKSSEGVGDTGGGRPEEIVPGEASPLDALDDALHDTLHDTLHDALHAVVAPLTSSAGTVTGVLRRARRSRHRRFVMRGSLSVVLLGGALVAGPLLSGRTVSGGVRTAAPPAAVVDIATAYPLAEGPLRKNAGVHVDRPVNALAWPARGVPLPSQVMVLAQGYLAGGGAAAAVVEQLWAQDEAGGMFFVLQGWTVGASGVSRAVVLAGDYTAASGLITMYEAPLRFAHPAPGELDTADDVRDVAELSVWTPGSNRLVVLGAPQVTRVLYAKDGRTLIEEPTVDGVAVFRRASGGRPGDGVQVRDAHDQALTPPGTWSVGDVALRGDVAVYKGGAWQVVRVSAPASGGPSPSAAAVRPRTPSGSSAGVRAGAPTGAVMH